MIQIVGQPPIRLGCTGRVHTDKRSKRSVVLSYPPINSICPVRIFPSKRADLDSLLALGHLVALRWRRPGRNTTTKQHRKHQKNTRGLELDQTTHTARRAFEPAAHSSPRTWQPQADPRQLFYNNDMYHTHASVVMI